MNLRGVPYVLRHLLRSADPAECAASSFDNFHAPGLIYVNLLRTPRLTAKLYIAVPGAVTPNADGYVVNPHNHGYCFETHVLCGRMQNVTFRERDDGESWTEFAFHSALRGVPRMDTVGPVRLASTFGRPLEAGDSYYLDDKTIHTIIVPSDRLTILFLLQYEDTGAPSTRLFTHDGGPPSLDGLYRPMSAYRVAEMIDLTWRHGVQ